MTSLGAGKAAENIFDRMANLLLRLSPGAVIERATLPAQVAVDRDGLLAERLAGDADGQRIVRLWRNRNCMVVPRGFAAKPAFAVALAAASMPVVFRCSGGRAVTHGPGVANLSIIARGGPVTGDPGEAVFGELTGLVSRLLASLGLPTETGYVEGAHCDGRFNVTARGRKIAGTAVHVMQRNGERVTVAHASIAMTPAPAALREIVRFETALGLEADFHLEAHTCIMDELVYASAEKDEVRAA